MLVAGLLAALHPVNLPTVAVVEVFMRAVDLFFGDAVVCVQSAFPPPAGDMVPTFTPASDSVSVVQLIRRALLFSLRIHLREFPGHWPQYRLLAHSFILTGEQKT